MYFSFEGNFGTLPVDNKKGRAVSKRKDHHCRGTKGWTRKESRIRCSTPISVEMGLKSSTRTLGPDRLV